MKTEQDKISELEKALAEMHLKLRVSEEIIALASKKYRVDLKKNFGTKPYPDSGEKLVAGSKRSAKR